ncbi:sperm microtubule associated protein 2 isoform 2-T2 [Sarcophilus harrisii]
MPDVIVTELQTWKKSNHHSHHGSRQRRICHHRINELAKPKVNHQIVVDRPSVYWTDKIQPDTTLSVTSPIVTPRLEELSRPKRFYSTYYNESRQGIGIQTQTQKERRCPYLKRSAQDTCQ